MGNLKVGILVIGTVGLLVALWVAFAAAGEPQSAWLVCQVAGMDSVCR